MDLPVLYVLLFLAALVCFLVAAFAPRQPPRVNLVALGLAFWVLVPLIRTLHGL
jgi:hypothetical protein